MKIVICASIDFTPKIKEIADVLSGQGHEVEMPFYSQKILNKVTMAVSFFIWCFLVYWIET